MARYFPIRTDKAEGVREEYQTELNCMTSQELLNEFFSYLDYTEESDSGREFHPIEFSSCRVMMSEPFGMVLQKLREISK